MLLKRMLEPWLWPWFRAVGVALCGVPLQHALVSHLLFSALFAEPLGTKNAPGRRVPVARPTAKCDYLCLLL